MTFKKRKCHVLLIVFITLVPSVLVRAQNGDTKQVTIEGQLVCSECWFEADRNTTPYGTAADIQCAIDCEVKGIPPAVAVRQGSQFKLYRLERGKFNQDSKQWLEHIGKWVKVSGRVRSQGDQDYIAVDEFAPSATPARSSQLSAIGSVAELILKDLFGVEQKLSGYRGKIVVLNFWATWCVPCRNEMPELARIQNEYAPLGVQVVGAAADALKDRAEVLQFIKESGINFPIWVGAKTTHMAQFGLGPALPATVIVARDGKTISVFPKVITEQELGKEIDRLLERDVSALKSKELLESNVELASVVPS